MFAKRTYKAITLLGMLLTAIALSAAFWSPAAALIPGNSLQSNFDFPHGEWGRFTIFNSEAVERSSIGYPDGEWGRFTIFNSLDLAQQTSSISFENSSLATYLYYGNIDYYRRLNVTNNAGSETLVTTAIRNPPSALYIYYSDFYSRLNATNNAEAANLVAITGIENPSLATYLYYGNFSYYNNLP